MNFNYSIQALCISMSRIIYKRLDANHKHIFRKFEKEIKVCTKLSADIQFLLLLLLKKVGSARLRESDIHLTSPKTPAPQYQPIDRKKRKGNRVEDYSSDRAA